MNSLLEESDGNASCSFLMSGGGSPDSLNTGYLFDSSGNSSFDDADYVIPETPSPVFSKISQNSSSQRSKPPLLVINDEAEILISDDETGNEAVVRNAQMEEDEAFARCLQAQFDSEEQQPAVGQGPSMRHRAPTFGASDSTGFCGIPGCYAFASSHVGYCRRFGCSENSMTGGIPNDLEHCLMVVHQATGYSSTQHTAWLYYIFIMASFQAITTPAAAITSHQICGNKSSTNGSGVASFKAAETVIELASMFKEKPDPSNLVFGTAFTDHMLTIEWSASDGWQKPHIGPFKNLSMHPASSSLQYAVELFEGLKAYRGVDNNIRLFRPLNNMERMLRSACRVGLPSFDKEELLECIKKLVEIEKAWVPDSSSASLYIRPTLIGTEPSLGIKKPSQALLYVILSPVGSYFSTRSFLSLWADPKYTRAWRGGTGDCKMGGNYGASIYAQYEALEMGCQQVLWLYGDNHQITEVGTMNLFLYWINENGDDRQRKRSAKIETLRSRSIPSHLVGVYLARNISGKGPVLGSARDSRRVQNGPCLIRRLKELNRRVMVDLEVCWGEFKVTERYLTMGDLTAALKENRVKEMFGAGTACIVCPVGCILYKGDYGRIESDWTYLVQ
ncbi:Branched-chain-amino-acid aminotransferase, cytosolic [Acipenser ruthenus]|uniref:branched-chain-amino-acid transaminase n=1 Tax=Acipenser ruthenus TaxID=7906 RepID=A0A662YVZ0_ACIRT|nr:Branched-chain-amino-acid aminotransferase, cytosolic [Acipenser ruthenus]